MLLQLTVAAAAAAFVVFLPTYPAAGVIPAAPILVLLLLLSCCYLAAAYNTAPAVLLLLLQKLHLFMLLPLFPAASMLCMHAIACNAFACMLALQAFWPPFACFASKCFALQAKLATCCKSKRCLLRKLMQAKLAKGITFWSSGVLEFLVGLTKQCLDFKSKLKCSHLGLKSGPFLSGGCINLVPITCCKAAKCSHL